MQPQRDLDYTTYLVLVTCVARKRARVAETFSEQPILNSLYEAPTRHHDLDEDGQKTDR